LRQKENLTVIDIVQCRWGLPKLPKSIHDRYTLISRDEKIQKKSSEYKIAKKQYEAKTGAFKS